MNFKGFIEEEFALIRESLNTPVEFSNIETVESDTYYYFNINDKIFRAVIETVDDESAIIFEQKIKGIFTYEGFQNNLNKKESLALFSTLKTLLKYLKTSKNYIYTDSKKKLSLYKKILLTIPEIKSVNSTEDNIPYIIGFGLQNKLEPKTKFKFKFWR